MPTFNNGESAASVRTKINAAIDKVDGASPITTVNIDGGTIDGTVIGGSTPAAISGTTGQFGTSLNVDGTITSDGLTVDGDATISGAARNLIFVETDQTDKNTRLRQNGGNFTISTLADDLATATVRIFISNATGDISFYEDTGTTPKFFWDASTERLGIGNVAPATALDVTGTVTADGLTVDGNIGVNRTATSQAGFTIIDVGGSAVSGLLDLRQNDIRQTRIYNSSSDTIIRNEGGDIYLQPDEVTAIRIQDGGDISFYEDTGTTPKFFWDASAEALFLGSGGYSNPAANLVINDSATSGFKAKLTSSAFNADGNWIGLGMGYHNNYMKSAIISEAKDGNARANLHFALDSDLGSGNVGLADAKMTITYGGNVGIGTSSPSTPSGKCLTLYDATIPRLNFKNSTTGDTATDGAELYVSGNQFVIQNRESSVIVFGTATTERMRIDASGNLLLAGTGTPTSSAGNLVIYNGTAPTGNATNGVILYAEDVSASSELKVRDEAGNVTTLSPHNFDLIPEGPSEDMAWSYYSERDGKRINVDMLKAIRLLEQITGEKLVHMA